MGTPAAETTIAYMYGGDDIVAKQKVHLDQSRSKTRSSFKYGSLHSV